MKHSYMFIGGPLDGQRKQTWPTGEMPARFHDAPVVDLDEPGSSRPATLTYHRYTLRFFNTATDVVTFYALGTMSDIDAMTMLLEGYRPAVERDVAA